MKLQFKGMIPWWFWVLWVAQFLFAIALTGGVLYVAIHFIRKFW